MINIAKSHDIRPLEHFQALPYAFHGLAGLIGPERNRDPAMREERAEADPGLRALGCQVQNGIPRPKFSCWASFRAARRPMMAGARRTTKLDDGGKTVKYLDIGEKFLDANKDLPKDIMPDALHPNAKGYQIWADAILPSVKEMMGVN